MRGHRDLTAVAAAAVLCALVAVAVPFEGIRLIAAVPLCLILPGYSIAAAAFGKRSLAVPQQLLLTVALSLAALVIGALILNYAPGGVRTASWALLLVVLVLGACAIAARRRAAPVAKSPPRLQLRVRSAQVALLVGAALTAGAGLALAWTPLPAKNAVGYAQLWMLPEEGPGADAFRVGVVSQQQDPTEYRLELQTGSAGRTFFTSRLSLQPGEEREFEVPVGRAQSAEPRQFTALLFRRGQSGEVYRRVTGWIPGAGSGT
jgi:hypothetical protein